MNKMMKAVKIIGITLTVIAVAFVAVYFIQSKAIAGGNNYQAVTSEYVPATENVTEATEVATEASTEEVTETANKQVDADKFQ